MTIMKVAQGDKLRWPCASPPRGSSTRRCVAASSKDVGTMAGSRWLQWLPSLRYSLAGPAGPAEGNQP
jgi:hypothetical protein